MSFVETYKSFYTQLKSDVDGSSNPFEAAVGSRIFAVQAPAGVSFPFAVYEVDAPTVEPYFSSVEKLETSADVHIFGKAELGVDALLDIEELLSQSDQMETSIYHLGLLRNSTLGAQPSPVRRRSSRVFLTRDSVE